LLLAPHENFLPCQDQSYYPSKPCANIIIYIYINILEI
jgi:hypothetical protein